MTLDFFYNDSPPKTDGITVYKINSKTHHRVEVGQLALNGVLRLNVPNKSLAEIDRKDINTYQLEFKVYSLDSNGQQSSRVNKTNVEELLVNSSSLGYFDNSKLVLWDQYLS